jgi:hypothetical protein
LNRYLAALQDLENADHPPDPNAAGGAGAGGEASGGAGAGTGGAGAGGAP